MFVVFTTTPRFGSKISPDSTPPEKLLPPASSTLPLLSRVAAWSRRAVFRFPAETKPAPAWDGLKVSVVFRNVPLLLPPATKTRPSASKVAVWETRGELIVGPALKVLVGGLKMSVVAAVAPRLKPPLMRTRPSGRTVATACLRDTVIVAERAVNVPAEGS